MPKNIEWECIITEPFLWDMKRLPKSVRRKVEKLAIDMPCEKIFNHPHIEKMSGAKNKYRIRIGNFRVGFAIYSKEKQIIFLRVMARKDFYRHFP